MNNLSYRLPLSLQDGAWKFDYGQEAIQLIDAHINDPLPPDMQEAFKLGRNAIFMNPSNLMFMDAGLTYEGHSQTEIKLAWQQEDGTVRLGIWVANGTNENIFYGDLIIRMEDQELGTIVDLDTLSLDEIVQAGSSRIIYLDVPAKYVKTGNQSWTVVSTNLKVKFR